MVYSAEERISDIEDLSKKQSLFSLFSKGIPVLPREHWREKKEKNTQGCGTIRKGITVLLIKDKEI